MSLMKRMLASVGIGSAQVDTYLDRPQLAPGEWLQGEVRIQGGNLAQTIDDLYLYVITRYKRETEDSSHYEDCKLLKASIAPRFTLEPQESKILPLEIQLPFQTPLSLGGQPVWITTALDIALAVNPRDRDDLIITPHPLQQAVFQALDQLGFSRKQIECEYHPHAAGGYPFIQEFEFYPGASYRAYFQELELFFHLESDDRLRVYLEIDRRVRGLGSFLQEMAGLDDRYSLIEVTARDLARGSEAIVQRLQAVLSQAM